MKRKGAILLAGTHSGVGKTTISLGIMGALKKRGEKVKPFKVGPDYIDPQFHQYVTGIPSRNLDSHLIDPRVLESLFHKNVGDDEIAVIEGVMGLYDGLGTHRDQGSSAHISKIVKAPVILIIDGKGMSASAAAMVLGYQAYDKEVDIQGVIINNLSGDKHYDLLRQAIERDTGIPCIGYLKQQKQIQLASRHLGLIPSMEVPELKEKVAQMVEMIEETVDVDLLIEIALRWQPSSPKSPEYSRECKDMGTGLNIAYAYDQAFHFYYEDNLDLLREMNVTLIPFSPLKDTVLPKDIHALYIGGGFPEVFAPELEANEALRREIKKKSEEGLPIYGECGGLMYLTKGIKTIEGKVHPMVGIFDVYSEMTQRLQRFGYAEIQVSEESGILKDVGKVKTHEFHRSRLESQEQNYSYTVQKKRDDKVVDRWQCGLEKNNTLGAYGHIHFYSNLNFPKAWIEAAKSYKKKCSS
ncbi:cobyrinic acid a,c-diamide synthase [Alkaliphilus metalliredigens QYMF]|uniref:Cobyrinate a,c-diamide synthase n=1 Tax=Alkaliphilus metalliredigens (strain QYMF) TaxID=293826 RepID=A6TJE0_ALKMQ|nr:cobyrinate a,c-diamide synthase [Alkaliphilus metalliredigens]ABR46308.1 cobyrinic acid a,c-diamide synthase [Alkaliphilus metalliredigens QYMF]